MTTARAQRRYQVFVSSTFSDLQAERITVTKALLDMGAIPAGMENFPAAQMPPSEVIRGVIDSSDYYVLVIANRYGSQNEEGISYTEAEYEYAREQGVPVLAFLHAEPDSLSMSRSEPEADGRDRLEAFRHKVKSSHHVRSWRTPDDLAATVVTSLHQAIEVMPRPGWVRDPLPASATGSDSEPVPDFVALFEQALGPEAVDPSTSDEPPADTDRRPAEVGPIRVRLNRLVEQVVSLEQLDRSRTDLAMSDLTGVLHRQRLNELKRVCAPLVSAAVEAIVHGEPVTLDLCRDLITDLDRGSRRGGDVDLLNLPRVPATLFLHAVGVAATYTDDMALVGSLLSEAVTVIDPWSNTAVPAARALTSDLLVGQGWSSQYLHNYLVPLLGDGSGLGRPAVDRCWQRWAYYHAAAVTYWGQDALPYLQVMSDTGWSGRLDVVVADEAKKRALPPSPSLIEHGYCGASTDDFERAAVKMAEHYLNWAHYSSTTAHEPSYPEPVGGV